MTRWPFVSLLMFLAACATDSAPEPQGPLMPMIETQIVEVPVPVACGAAERLGPDPVYAANPDALRDLPHKAPIDTLTDRQKLENWLHITKLQTVEIEQRKFREREVRAALSAC